MNLAASAATVTIDSELPAAAALADAAAAAPTTPTVGSIGLLMNATTVDRARAVVNALDSAGTGIAAAGLVGQLDDTATSAVTENQFAVARISTRRALLVEGVASGTNLNVNLAASAATVTVDSELTTADLDTGAGTDTRAVVGLALTKSGGAVLAPAAPVSNALVDQPLFVAIGGLDAADLTKFRAPYVYTPQDGTSGYPAIYTNSYPLLHNGVSWDVQRAAVNALNSIGTWIAAAGMVAQYDDTAPTAITENQFGNVRMSSDRRLYVEQPYVQGRVTADGQIKGSAGFVHSISIAALTATPTAGLLTIYDSLTETGTVLYSEWVFATDVGHTIFLDVPFATGLYVGYDATLSSVQVQISYR